MKMRLCLLLFLNVRVRLSFFGNLSEDELYLLMFLNVRVRLSFFGNFSEDEADVPEFRVMMVLFRDL